VDSLRPESAQALASQLNAAGYEVIVSIGEVVENRIGSNCGQYVLTYLNGKHPVIDGYSYQVQTL
jgi:23S rRNA (adenine2503-C2)-methyltransferase